MEMIHPTSGKRLDALLKYGPVCEMQARGLFAELVGHLLFMKNETNLHHG